MADATQPMRASELAAFDEGPIRPVHSIGGGLTRTGVPVVIVKLDDGTRVMLEPPKIEAVRKVYNEAIKAANQQHQS